MIRRYLPRACALATALALACAPAALAEDGDGDGDEIPVTELSPLATGETIVVGETDKSVETCSRPIVANWLSAYGDPRDYFTAPGGDFEAGAGGWSLRNRAQVVYGNGGKVLRLPERASATTPYFCVDLDYPTLRFFAADVGDEGEGTLAVDLVYPGVAEKNVRRGARLRAPRRFALTEDVGLYPEFASPTPGWRKVAIRFTARGDDADFRIDNVLIDPRMR